MGSKRLIDFTEEDLKELGNKQVIIDDSIGGKNCWTGSLESLLHRRITIPDVLTKDEKTYVKNYIGDYPYKIHSFEKYRLNEVDEYLVCSYYYSEGYLQSVQLFPFKKGTRFAGMKLNKGYTLEQLGLTEED